MVIFRRLPTWESSFLCVTHHNCPSTLSHIHLVFLAPERKPCTSAEPFVTWPTSVVQDSGRCQTRACADRLNTLFVPVALRANRCNIFLLLPLHCGVIASRCRKIGVSRPPCSIRSKSSHASPKEAAVEITGHLKSAMTGDGLCRAGLGNWEWSRATKCGKRKRVLRKTCFSPARIIPWRELPSLWCGGGGHYIPIFKLSS